MEKAELLMMEMGMSKFIWQWIEAKCTHYGGYVGHGAKSIN
jgi:hypothetical protein